MIGSLRALVLAVAATLIIAPADAQQQPIFEPEPAWITPVELPSPDDADTGAVRMMLSDIQVRFGAQTDETYRRTVYKIVTSQGLAAGSIAMDWNPETEDLKVHKLQIRRGDQIIDVLSRQDFLVLRRETNLQFAMLNGVLTATLQPEGLKVGDIIDVSTTLVRRDPIVQGKSEGFAMGMTPSPVDRMRVRAVWGKDSPMTWRASSDLPAAKLTETGEQSEFLLDLLDVAPSRPPAGAPMRYQFERVLEWTEFKSWADVSALMAPLYESASKLNPDSELRAEIETIKAKSKSPEERASAALALVQEQVRYVFLGMDLGALKPAHVDRTWSRRFGDCKGKTALLLAILHELGIEAEPALVSTGWGDGLDERLPRIGHFDHVIVRAVIGGRTYWMDGTRSGDGAIATLATPPYYWALPVRPTGATLEKLTLEPLAAPESEQTIEFDLAADIEKPVQMRATVILRGDSASAMRFALSSVAASEVDLTLKDYWSSMLPEITPNTVSQAYDAARGELVLKAEGPAELEWSTGWGRQVYAVHDSSVGGGYDLSREEGPNKDAPFSVAFPYYSAYTTIVRLPDNGKGYSLRGSDFDEIIGGVAYKRQTELANGVLTMRMSARSLAPEFPASEAATVEGALGELRKNRLFLLAPGAAPTTLQDVAMLAANGGDDLVEAIASLSRMIDASPTRTDYYSLRARLHMMNDRDAEALKDIDKAIELQPNVALHFIQRAGLRDEQDATGRRADIATALGLEPNSPDILTAAAYLENEMSNHGQALSYLDSALALRPGDPGLLIERGTIRAKTGQTPEALEDFAKARGAIHGDAVMLNQLCWAKVTMNVSVESALEDCNASLAIRPDYAPALDSRAFVELRLGQLDNAIASFDKALKLAPKMSASLYGRGVAKLRKGLTAEGEADLQAAREVAPDVDKRFAGFGITP